MFQRENGYVRSQFKYKYPSSKLLCCWKSNDHCCFTTMLLHQATKKLGELGDRNLSYVIGDEMKIGHPLQLSLLPLKCLTRMIWPFCSFNRRESVPEMISANLEQSALVPGWKGRTSPCAWRIQLFGFGCTDRVLEKIQGVATENQFFSTRQMLKEIDLFCLPTGN